MTYGARSTRVPVASITLALCFAVPAPAQSLLEQADLSGEVRVRSEFDARTAGQDADFATLLRTRLGVGVALDSTVQVFIQLSDSRAFGEEENTLTDASADQLDLHQGYIQWRPLEDAWLRAGRQELAFADERLIGTVGWANVTRSFDGIRGHLRRGDWAVDAFAMTLRERDLLLATGLDPRDNEGLNTDRDLFGVWANRGWLDLFLLADRNASEPGIVDIDRFTVGGYGRAARGPWSGTLSLAVQLGEQTRQGVPRQDIGAFMASGEVARAWQGDWGVVTAAQLDYLSGDSEPLDDDYAAFNTLYATNHAFYGFMDLFLDIPRQTGFAGLIDFILRGVGRRDDWLLRADLHVLQLAEENPAGDRYLGIELDLTVRRAITRGFVLQGGYSFFEPGSAAEVAPVGLGDELLHWAYLQGTAGF